MKILHTNFHQDKGGGHVTYILNLLRDQSHENFVACPPSSRLCQVLAERDFPGLLPMEFPSSIKQVGGMLKSAIALRRAINLHGIDIVHTNGSPDNRIALYASLLPGKKFKVIFTKHNTKKITGFISKWRLHRFNDAVIFVSDSVLDLAGLKRGNPRYHVIEHGIDTDYWKRQGPVSTGGMIHLVSNSGTQGHKGWQHMQEAVHSLNPEEQARLSVVVLGRHLRENTPLVTFPGFIEDPRPYLEEADIGFVLSYQEASSFASREMTAMGLPVISSDFPNATKNLDPGCGWIVARRSSQAVVEVLRKILAMRPEEINAMKLAARRKAEADFSLEKMLARTRAVYESLMGNAAKA